MILVFRATALALVLGLLATSARAQTTGTVGGTLTSTATGLPVSATSAVILYDSTGKARYIASSDASGHYEFGGLAAGTYFLEVEAAGFAEQLHSGIPCAATDCPITGGTPIAVTAGATTTVDVALVPEGRISGTVRRASDGTPLQWNVALYNASSSFVSSVFSIGDGTFTFGGLPAGVYYVRTEGSGLGNVLDELYGGIVCPRLLSVSYCRVESGTPITVTAGMTVSNIDFSLDTAGTVAGRVTASADGTPLSNVTVALYSGSSRISSDETDATGAYAIDSLPAGTYTVRTMVAAGVNYVDEWFPDACFACGASPGAVAVTAGTATSGIDISLATGGTIAGAVTFTSPSSVFLPGIDVYDSRGVFVKSAQSVSPSPYPVPPGTYLWQATGLPAGTHYVKTSNLAIVVPKGGALWMGFLVDELYDNVVCVTEDCLPTRGTPVSVTAGATTGGIDFTLVYGAAISGQLPDITVPDTGNTRPMVSLYDARGVRVRSDRVASAGLFGERFESAGLPAGTYYVKMDRPEPGRYPSALYRDIPCNGCAATGGTPVTVALGASADITFTALPSRAISGTVRSAPSTPLSTIVVQIFSPNGTFAGSATTTADGRYSVKGLNPGTYYARTSNQRGYVDEIYPDLACGGCDATVGTPVTVTADADTTGIDFTLAPGTTLSGRVTTATSLPLNGSVEVYTAAGSLAALPVADLFGRYETTVPQASYRARTQPIAGYVQELFADMPCPQGTCDPASGTPIVVGATPVGGIDFALAACSTMTIAPTRLANAAVGSPYRQTLTVAGGTPPVAFTITSGALPGGLTLDASTGVLSGTPTTASMYSFTVSAADNAGCIATRAYTLDVPPCPFTLGGGFASLRAEGEPWLITVSGACGDWTATSNASWLRIAEVSAMWVVVIADPNSSTSPRTGTVAIGPRVFTIHQSGSVPSGPFGLLETPVDGATVRGSVAVTGWALDDIGVTRVSVYRDAVAGEPAGYVFIGDATFVEGARPDVEAAFPTTPFNARAGWGYLLLTNMLPNAGNGTFRLHAFAQDSDGVTAPLGTRTITASNADATLPFGAIDTPSQGGTVSGAAYLNWGWALTPLPQTIPTSGVSIQVYIDGIPIGPLTQYNLFRSDVSSLFPGLNNSAGPVGYRVFDTTSLEEGIHTIAWVVTDDGGRAEGIGSRFFHVNNSAWSASAAGEVRLKPDTPDASSVVAGFSRTPGIDVERRAASLATVPVARETILLWRDGAGGWAPIEANPRGERAIAIRELERIEVNLAADVSAACAPTYAGYHVANGELRALPAGASLDRASGMFYWQPGAGFVGTYDLIFVRTACDGARSRIPLAVTLTPAR